VTSSLCLAIRRGCWKCRSGKIGSRSQGWKMQEWKSQEQIAGLENTAVEKSGADRRAGKCRSGEVRSDNWWKAVIKEKRIGLWLSVFLRNVPYMTNIHISDFHNGVLSVCTGPDWCENRHIFAVAVYTNEHVRDRFHYFSRILLALVYTMLLWRLRIYCALVYHTYRSYSFSHVYGFL